MATTEKLKKVNEEVKEVSSLDDSTLKLREKEINEAQKKIQEAKNQLSNERIALERERVDVITEKETSILNKNKELRALETKISDLLTKFKQAENKLELAKSTYQTELSKYKNEQYAKVQDNVKNKLQSDLNELKKDYEKNIALITDSIKFDRQKLDDAFKSLVQEYQNVLEEKEKLYNDRLKDVNNAYKTLEQEISKVSNTLEKEAELKVGLNALQNKSKLIEKSIEKGVELKYSDIVQERNRYQQELNNNKLKLEALYKDYTNLKDSTSTIEFIEKTKLVKDYETAQKTLQELNKKYSEYSSQDIDELKRKASTYDDLNALYNKKCEELREAKNQLECSKTEEQNVDALMFQKRALMNEIKVEKDLVGHLEMKIKNLEDRLDNRKTQGLESKAIEEVLPRFEDQTQNKTTGLNEQVWLKDIITKCEKSGYKFPQRLFYSFHTSLMVSDMSPLTVLAGVSGTGKSKLPQLYSRFGGLYFISVPVQPDYDSPQSLFGYFNSIEKQFNATSLLRAIVPFQKDKSKSISKDNIYDLSDNVLLVLLDEMNLAHIELYFSDLLSKLEERRDGEDVSIEVDLGAGKDKYEIALTDNVKWIGTMNEDETTKSLSDKVIDRGNVISFPRPTKFERYINRNTSKLEDEASKISKQLWNYWANEKAELTDEESDKYMKIVMEINDALGKANRAIGHRVWQSIENYMISHPLVKSYKDDEAKRIKALKYAFEEAIVYKIMPKLRGIETEGYQFTDCLEPIEKILETNHLDSIIDDYKSALKSVTNTFYWNSSEFLKVDYNMED